MCVCVCVCVCVCCAFVSLDNVKDARYIHQNTKTFYVFIKTTKTV